jgi:hypothetical protein
MYKKHLTSGIAFLIIILFVDLVHAQIPRQRAEPGGPVEEVFWAPTIIGTSSVTNLPQNNLNFTIMHAFGIATNGIEDLFGLDGAANIRFGIDYGVHDRLSIGMGRSRFDKLYDFRFKANLLRQTKDDKMPLELAVKGGMGIMTLENGFDVKDRLSYLGSVMIARKFSERVSLQVTPMFAHFNTVFIERGADNEILEEENDHIALGLAGRLGLNERIALMLEFIPVLGERSDGTKNAFAVGFDIETGGHVFQLFLTTSQGMTEQHIIARNVDGFFDGDFRFGFNVNRVFAFGTP